MKKIISVFLACVLVLGMAAGLSGCGNSAGSASSVSSSAAGAPQSEAATGFTAADDPIISSNGDTQTIRDCLGRQVRLPAEPGKVAVLDSFAGEAVVMTGAGDKIATCPNGTKSDQLLAEMCPSLADVPVIMSDGSFNAESLISLGADAVIVKLTLYQADGEKEKLDSLGIPYVVSDYGNMQEQIYALRMVGAVCGSASYDKACRIADYYSSVIGRADAIREQIPDSEVVRVYHSINQAVMTDGTESLGNDWISCVGAVDVSAGNDASMTFEDNDYYAGLEQIFQWDPDVIICNEADTRDYLLTDSKWSDLRAVSTKKVYNIPVSATRWGQRGSLETFFAILWLGKTIYPSYYEGVDLRSEVTSFYSDIEGISIDDATYGKIIAGKGLRNGSSSSGS